MDLHFTPEQAAQLGRRAMGLAAAGQELAVFGETEPDLAGSCGVEICALEARSILAGGYLTRIHQAVQAAQLGRPVMLAANDVEALARLEQVITLGSSRIALKAAAMDAQAGQDGLAKVGSFVGLASGVVGLVKSLW